MAGKLIKRESENISKGLEDYKKKHEVHSHYVSASLLVAMLEENPEIVGFKIEHTHDEEEVHQLIISGVNSNCEVVSTSCIVGPPPCPPRCKPKFV